MLYKAPIDNDISEAIFGHRIEGSKENYFDRHDLDWIASEYMKAPFSREGVGRLNHLEKEKQKLEARITTQQEEIEQLQQQLKTREHDTSSIKLLIAQLMHRMNEIETRQKTKESKK